MTYKYLLKGSDGKTYEWSKAILDTQINRLEYELEKIRKTFDLLKEPIIYEVKKQILNILSDHKSHRYYQVRTDARIEFVSWELVVRAYKELVEDKKIIEKRGWVKLGS